MEVEVFIHQCHQSPAEGLWGVISQWDWPGVQVCRADSGGLRKS